MYCLTTSLEHPVDCLLLATDPLSQWRCSCTTREKGNKTFHKTPSIHTTPALTLYLLLLHPSCSHYLFQISPSPSLSLDPSS